MTANKIPKEVRNYCLQECIDEYVRSRTHRKLLAEWYFVDGEEDPSSTMTVTPAAVGDFFNGGSMRSYRGSYDGSYDGGSYRRRRDSMGRYSREGEDLAEQIKGMMGQLPEDARGAAEKLLHKLEG